MYLCPPTRHMHVCLSACLSCAPPTHTLPHLHTPIDATPTMTVRGARCLRRAEQVRGLAATRSERPHRQTGQQVTADKEEALVSRPRPRPLSLCTQLSILLFPSALFPSHARLTNTHPCPHMCSLYPIYPAHDIYPIYPTYLISPRP